LGGDDVLAAILDAWIACGSSNISSLCPSLEPLLDKAVSASVFLFDRIFPTQGYRASSFDHRRRGEQGDPVALLPDA
jgi:hypothetical protein